jgi:hypothetical protein
VSAGSYERRHGAGIEIEADHLAPGGKQPARHVSAHSAEPYQAKAHGPSANVTRFTKFLWIALLCYG